MEKEKIENGELETWTPKEVEAGLRGGNIVLVDVRTPAEYAFEHVEGALLLPMAFLIRGFCPKIKTNASFSCAGLRRDPKKWHAEPLRPGRTGLRI